MSHMAMMLSRPPRPWILLLLLSGPASAAVVGDPELFRLVGAGNRANFERLVTWKGRMSVEEVVKYPETGREHRSSSAVSFAYDRRRNAVRWNRRTRLERSSPDAPDQPSVRE